MQKQLEQYLDSLEKPLSKLSATERREWRVEAGQHIESLVAAHEELGTEQEAALKAAIAQFGDAQVIANHMRSESARRRFYVSPAQGLAGALVLQLVVAILGLVALGVLSVIYIRMDGVPVGAIAFMSGALLAGTPLIGGALLGCNGHRWRLTPSAGSQDRITMASTYLGIFFAVVLIFAADNVLWALADPSWHRAPGIDVRSAFLINSRSLFLRLSLTILSASVGRAYSITRHRRRVKAAVR